MNKLQDWLGKGPARCALLLYLSVGLLQFLIIPAGFEAWFGVHWMLATLCAAVLAWIPAAGQILGLAIAVDVLNLPLFLAVAVFLWPLWFAGIVYAVRRFTGESGGSGRRDGDGGFQRSLRVFGEKRDMANADSSQTEAAQPH